MQRVKMIVMMMMIFSILKKPSELEVACFEAKKLVAGRKVIVLGAE